MKKNYPTCYLKIIPSSNNKFGQNTHWNMKTCKSFIKSDTFMLYLREQLHLNSKSTMQVTLTQLFWSTISNWYNEKIYRDRINQLPIRKIQNLENCRKSVQAYALIPIRTLYYPRITLLSKIYRRNWGITT